MRKIIILLLLASPAIINAQLIRPLVRYAEFSEKLNSIVTSFRNNYYQIQGESLMSDKDRDIFRSEIKLPGAIRTVIYRFHSLQDTTASWQALMFSGDNYGEASKIYKHTFRLLNNSRVNLSGSAPAFFKGNFIAPDPSVTFAHTYFQLKTDDKAYALFVAEIELVNTGIENWEVRLNLHNKKFDNEIY